jgi:hypothetical protein
VKDIVARNHLINFFQLQNSRSDHMNLKLLW